MLSTIITYLCVFLLGIDIYEFENFETLSGKAYDVLLKEHVLVWKRYVFGGKRERERERERDIR